jgi:hypothetical protein
MALLEKIPEKSYGIIECLVWTILASIPAIILLLLKVNIFILFSYYSILLFMVFGFASHLRSHDVDKDIKTLIGKTKEVRRQIKKYGKNHEI